MNFPKDVWMDTDQVSISGSWNRGIYRGVFQCGLINNCTHDDPLP